MALLIYIDTAILLVLGVLHLYWAVAGVTSAAVLPSGPDGKLMFVPGKGATVLVGVALICLAAITQANTGTFDAWVSRSLIRQATGGIGVIFLARAMGDFKYVGLTKRITNTRFARNDTFFYIPLCLFIAIISFLILSLT